MRHLGQERHVPPDTSGPASLRLAQLPDSPPPARNVERRNRLLDPLIRVVLIFCCSSNFICVQFLRTARTLANLEDLSEPVQLGSKAGPIASLQPLHRST